MKKKYILSIILVMAICTMLVFQNCSDIGVMHIGSERPCEGDGCTSGGLNNPVDPLTSLNLVLARSSADQELVAIDPTNGNIVKTYPGLIKTTENVSYHYEFASLGEVDGDGWVDFVIMRYSGNPNGATFVKVISSKTGQVLFELNSPTNYIRGFEVLYDMDGDNRKEILINNDDQLNVYSIIKNDGPLFNANAVLNTCGVQSAQEGILSDVNSDGVKDLVLACEGASNVSGVVTFFRNIIAIDLKPSVLAANRLIFTKEVESSTAAISAIYKLYANGKDLYIARTRITGSGLYNQLDVYQMDLLNPSNALKSEYSFTAGTDVNIQDIFLDQTEGSGVPELYFSHFQQAPSEMVHEIKMVSLEPSLLKTINEASIENQRPNIEFSHMRSLVLVDDFTGDGKKELLYTYTSRNMSNTILASYNYHTGQSEILQHYDLIGDHTTSLFYIGLQ